MDRKGPSAFISYSSKDQDVARRLAQDLQSLGVNLWFDQREILAGDSIVERIQDGLRASDYLLVIISQNSVQSKWVKLELEQAFARDLDSSEIRVIPLRLDDAEMPPYLRTIHYVDLGADYEAGLAELQQLFQRDRTGKAKVDEIFDVEKFARTLGAETHVSRGAEFYVGTILTLFTIAATVIASVPAFQGVLGDRARVYYTVVRHELSVPPGIDEDEIRKLLKQKGLADSTLHISLINKGDARAGEVKVGAEVTGAITYVNTDPSPASRPVWVNIQVDPVTQNTRIGRVTFKDLVPEKTIGVYLRYESNGSNFDCDVVCDGRMATIVNDLDAVPSWSLFQAFKTPLSVLGVGLVVSVVVAFVIATLRNPRLRRQFINVTDAAFPMVGRVLRALEQ